MELFKKRETVIQNMTFISIMAAINCVLLFLTSLLPYLLILLTLILPFASLIVCILCKKSFYPIYALVTIGLCFAVSFNAISNIIFYIVPALLSGFIFGFCLEKQVSPSYSILYSGFTYVICSYISLIFCEFLFNEDLQDLYFALFNLSTFSYRYYLTPLFIFAIGIIQSTLSYAFIHSAIKKLGIVEKDSEEGNYYIYTFVFILLTIIAIFVKPDTYLMFIGFTIYCFIYAEFDLLRKNKKLFAICQLVGLFLIAFTFGILFQYISKEFAIAILLIPIFVVVIIGFINNCLVKRKN